MHRPQTVGSESLMASTSISEHCKLKRWSGSEATDGHGQTFWELSKRKEVLFPRKRGSWPCSAILWLSFSYGRVSVPQNTLHDSALTLFLAPLLLCFLDAAHLLLLPHSTCPHPACFFPGALQNLRMCHLGPDPGWLASLTHAFTFPCRGADSRAMALSTDNSTLSVPSQLTYNSKWTLFMPAVCPSRQKQPFSYHTSNLSLVLQ